MTYGAIRRSLILIVIAASLFLLGMFVRGIMFRTWVEQSLLSDFALVPGPVVHVGPPIRPSSAGSDNEVLESVEEIDQRIGPRSIDQEIASEFSHTVYHGGVVRIRGVAEKENYYSGLDAGLRIAEGRDNTTVVLRFRDGTSTPPKHSPLRISTFADREGRNYHSVYRRDGLEGRPVVVTGEISRAYLPTVEQQSRILQRKRPRSPKWMQEPGIGYRGGFYFYTIEVVASAVASEADSPANDQGE